MAKRSRTEYSLLNIATGLGGYAVNTIAGFVCRIVFVRCLASDYLGINGLFTNILTMLSLAELGIGSAIVYALYKPLADNDQEKIASLVQFYGKAYRIIGCVVALVGLTMMPFLNFIIQEPPAIRENIHIIYLLYLFNTSSTYFFSYRGSLLMAAQRNYIVTGINYLFTIGQSVLQIVLLLTTREYIWYLLIQIVSALVYNVVISYIAKRQFPCIAKKDIKPLETEEKQGLIRNVRALVVVKLSGLLVNNTDNIITTYFGGLTTVGYASNYTLFSGLLNTLLNQLFTGVTASVGNYNVTENKERKLELFNFLNLLNFWLFGWAAIGIFVVSGDLVELFYGGDFVLHPSIPFVIALNFYMVGMQNAVWTFKNTLGLFRQGRYLLILTAAINLAASILLGRIWGLFGILIATAIARTVTNIWYDPYAVYKYGFGKSSREYFLRYIQYALILTACAAVCYFLCGLMDFPIIINILLKCLVCSAVPNGVFWLCFRKRREFSQVWEIASRLMSKLLRKKA